jgi:O-antigen/teichoic acid export membrane protein
MLTVGIAAQSIGFIVLARWLGSDQFGHLSMITAATNLGAAWCGLGTSEAMRRRAGRDPSLYPTLLGHCLILLFVSGTVLGENRRRPRRKLHGHLAVDFE